MEGGGERRSLGSGSGGARSVRRLCPLGIGPESCGAEERGFCGGEDEVFIRYKFFKVSHLQRLTLGSSTK